MRFARSSTGFKTVRRTDITLQANQNLTVNITLELGDLAETITVAGEAATVDISSATISEVVDHARIVELPIAGREVARLQTLVAGTVLASVSEETGKSIPGAVRISANGAGERQNSYRLDGANNTDPYFQENQSFPFPDALQEFSIQTSNYSASHGNNAGAVVNVVTRSGTNSFHGGAFEYLRDRTFNSKGFFAAEKDFLKRNQYGGFAGGPIRRNSTFFFGGWQRTRITNRASELIRFVPTAAQRRGDFSNCIAGVSAALQPGNRAAVPEQPDSCRSVGSGGGEGVCRAADVHACRTARSQFLEAPARIPTSSSRRWISSWARTTSSASVTFSTTSTTPRSSFPRTSSATSGPSLESDPRSQSIVDGVEADAELDAAQREHVRLQPPPHGAAAASGRPVHAGFRHPAPVLPEHTVGFRDQGARLLQLRRQPRSVIPARRVPVQQQDELDQGTARASSSASSSSTSGPEIYNDFRRAGHFISNGQFTRAPGAASGGHALADFLLGRLSTFDHGTGEYKNYRNLYQSYFFQDDFKISDRVTLNFGARYEPIGPWHDLVGRFQVFDMDAYQQGIRSTQYRGRASGTVLPRRSGRARGRHVARPEQRLGTLRLRMGRDRRRPHQHPRRRRHVLRHAPAGRLQQRRRERTAVEHSRQRRELDDPVGPLSDPYRPRTDFNALVHDYEDKDTIIGAANAPFPRPVLVESFDEVFNTPLTYNYNLAFEREITTGWMARAAYVGSTATQGRSSLSLNPAIYTPGGPVGNPQARRQLPEYSGINHFVQDREQPVSLAAAHAEPALCKRLHGQLELHPVGPAGHDRRAGTGALLPSRLREHRRHPAAWAARRYAPAPLRDIVGV